MMSLLFDPALIDTALRGLLAVVFAYIALVGAAGALKFMLLDQEVRVLARQQREMLEGLRTSLIERAEEQTRARQARIAERESEA